MKLTPFAATLKNGQSVLIREVTPEDRHLLEIGYDHLSNQSRYFRFLAARHHLTAKELDTFTNSNGPDHVAIGAVVLDAPEPEPIGIARYVRLPDQKQTAEIAITITDSHQRQGLGSLLLGTLSKYAQINGISEFYALVHHKNTAMLRLLGQLGGTQTLLGGAEIEFKIPLFMEPSARPSSSVNETFAAAYSLATIS